MEKAGFVGQTIRVGRVEITGGGGVLGDGCWLSPDTLVASSAKRKIDGGVR